MSVQRYEVIKETPKTYVVKGGISERVLKSTMSNKYCVFFEDEKSAQLFYERVKYNPKKPKRPKKPLTHFDRIKAMSVEEMAELYVDLIMQQKCVLGELERASAVVIAAVKRDLFVHAVAWLESEWTGFGLE